MLNISPKPTSQKASVPKQKSQQVLHADVDGVLGARQAGFDQCEASLHPHHEKRGDEDPDRVERDAQLFEGLVDARQLDDLGRFGLFFCGDDFVLLLFGQSPADGNEQQADSQRDEQRRNKTRSGSDHVKPPPIQKDRNGQRRAARSQIGRSAGADNTLSAGTTKKLGRRRPISRRGRRVQGSSLRRTGPTQAAGRRFPASQQTHHTRGAGAVAARWERPIETVLGRRVLAEWPRHALYVPISMGDELQGKNADGRVSK